MLKKTLLGVMAVAAMALAIPSMAQATDTGTPIPTLPTGVDNAHIADLDGNPVNADVTLTGSLRLTGAVAIVCDNHVVIDIHDDGTSDVTSFTVTNCIVQGAAGAVCSAAIGGTNLPWGDKLGFDTRAGINVFRDYVNVSFDLTLSGANCPITGTFSETGTLFPEVEITGGDTITAHFWDNSGPEVSTGTVSGPLGSATVEGTLSGTLTSDETDAFQLVNTGT